MRYLSLIFLILSSVQFHTQSNPAPCSELFFSEYIENSNFRALEIYNPTTSIIDLSDYEIKRYNNGSATASTSITLIGEIIPGDVYVILSTSSISPSVLDQADLISNIANFNGNDALELSNIATGETLDIIGEIGVDPGISWQVNTDSTSNVTMVRNSSISSGNLVWQGGSDLEWNTYGIGEYSFLGSHTQIGCPVPINPTAYPIGNGNYCVGDSVLFINSSFGGTPPYSVSWSVGGLPYSNGDSLTFEATSATSLSISMTITDNNLISDDTTFFITIRNVPNAGFSISTNTACAEDTIQLNGSGGPGIFSYDYSVDPSTCVVNAGGPTGSGYFTSNTSDYYTITQTLTDAYGCSDTAMHNITINVKDDASFTSLPDLCEDESLSLIHSDNSGSWSGTGVTDNGGGIGEFVPPAAGTYGVTYTTTGTCPDVYTDSLEVYETPVSGFNFSGTSTIDYTDLSSGNPTVFTWDFGDGNTSTQTNPSHTYTADGTYEVCLIVENANGCDDTLCQDVTIFGLGSFDLSENAFKFFPNPADERITVNSNSQIEVSIYNVIGEKVLNNIVQGNKTLDISTLSPGSYLIEFVSDGHKSVKKLIIN